MQFNFSRFLFAILLAVLPLPMMAQQGITDDNDAEDNGINVVAYFSKNDTLTYREYRYTANVTGNDTIVKQDVWEDYRLVVKDSTDSGYLIECTVLDYGEEGDQSVDILNLLEREMIGCNVQFKTDDLGEVLEIVNWKEVQQRMNKVADKIQKEAKAQLKGLPFDITKLKEMLSAAWASEEAFRTNFSPVSRLFSLHGMRFEQGEYDEEIEGEPLSVAAYYLKPDEDEGNFDGDYFVTTRQDLEMPLAEVAQLGIDVAKSMLICEAADELGDEQELTKAMREMEGTMNIELTNYNEYFADGWPKEVSELKAMHYLGTVRHSFVKFVWLTRGFAE